MNRVLMTVAVPLALGTACFLGGDDNSNPDGGGGPDGGGPTILPFQADSPFTYVAKVKNIMTGLAPTQAEVDSVANAGDDDAKQAALVALIDTWMTDTTAANGDPKDKFEAKMMTFFELAFQQTQLSQVDFIEVVPNGNGSIGTSPNSNLLIENVKESFARTVIELVMHQNQPFTNVFTTTQFMMTPALAELYAFMDWNVIDDVEKINDKFATQMKTVGVTVVDGNSIPYAQTIDPKSVNYMHWSFPNLTTIQPPGPSNPSPECQAATRSWVSTNNGNTPSAHLVHYLMYGDLEAYKINLGPPPNNNCNAFQADNNNAILNVATNNDFGTWKLVNVRAPAGTEALTPFWDATVLRAASELVLTTPRVGFFSTPAFHANWQTNTSNQMRVTINQAFIVALGAQVDGTDTTSVSDIGANPPGLDTVHTAGGAACVGCHQVLDPSRTILMNAYSDGYGTQGAPPATKGEFVFNGTIKPVNSVSDLANNLISHPYFANAWVQKLCFFANSEACDPDDPEIQRLIGNFKSSSFSWKKLIEDVLSSPVTTNAKSTLSTSTQWGPAAQGEIVSVARRDHLCSALNSRLGLVDSCQLGITTNKALKGIPEIAVGLPSDGYGRGAASPVLPVNPTLFYRSGLENICEDIAVELIDAKAPPNTGAQMFTSTAQSNIDTAIAFFVSNLMGIVGDDPRSPIMIGKLTDHYTQALANKAKPTDALKSTFVVACLSPNVAGIGM